MLGGGGFNGVWELQTRMWQHAAIHRGAAAAAAPGRQEARTAPERRGGRQACSRRLGGGGGTAALQHGNASRQVRCSWFLSFWNEMCICCSSRVPKCRRRGCERAEASPSWRFTEWTVHRLKCRPCWLVWNRFQGLSEETSSNAAKEPQQGTQTRFASLVIHIYRDQYYFTF